MKPVLIACAAALLASTAMAASSDALITRKQAARFVTGAPSGIKTLYDQNKDDAGTAILSQNFGDGFDSPQAADDFAVPKGHTWLVKEVDVTGIYFNGSGPASSENVFFYRDHLGLPGRSVAKCMNQNGTENGFGSFAIVLSKSCKANLPGGNTYWVSVQTNMDFNEGNWGWELSTTTNGNQAARRQSGSDCPTWCHINGDLMFALRGKDKH